MSESNSMVAVYGSDSDANAGTAELRKAGFDVRRLSIARKASGTAENPPDGRNDHALVARQRHPGHEHGSLWEAAFISFAGIGPILIAGPLAHLILMHLRGNILELNVLSAALYRLGIPVSTIVRYEYSLRADKVLLLANGEPAELIRAKDILRSTHPDEVDVHFAEAAVLTSG